MRTRSVCDFFLILVGSYENHCFEINAHTFIFQIGYPKCAFFDVRVFNPFAHTYRNLPLTACYRRNEQEKRRAYDQRVREIEHGCFSPLVFSASGGIGPTAKGSYRRLRKLRYWLHALTWHGFTYRLPCDIHGKILRLSRHVYTWQRFTYDVNPCHK